MIPDLVRRDCIVNPVHLDESGNPGAERQFLAGLILFRGLKCKPHAREIATKDNESSKKTWTLFQPLFSTDLLQYQLVHYIIYSQLTYKIFAF